MFRDKNRSIEARMLWSADDTFSIEGVSFTVDLSQRRDKSFATDFQISKNQPYFDSYFDLMELGSIKNMVELGIFRGGSAAFFWQLLDLDRFLGVEFDPDRLVGLDELFEGSADNRDARVLYGVDQADSELLSKATFDFFEGSKLDLVVDDASHLFEQSLASFNTLFPLLRPGGYYVIEDWAWAHKQGPYQEADGPWSNRNALTNLIFMLVMAAGTTGNTIERVEVQKHLAIVEAGSTPLDPASFDLETQYLSRNRALECI